MVNLVENQDLAVLNETQISISDNEFVITTSSEVEPTKYAWTGEVCDHGTGTGE